MVLLRGGVEKEIEIKSNLYKSFEIKLIAFLKDGHGVYKSSIIYKYDGGIQPLLIYPAAATRCYPRIRLR